jgi:hypothetical protein
MHVDTTVIVPVKQAVDVLKSLEWIDRAKRGEGVRRGEGEGGRLVGARLIEAVISAFARPALTWSSRFPNKLLRLAFDRSPSAERLEYAFLNISLVSWVRSFVLLAISLSRC